MSVDDFQFLLGVHGVNLERWPWHFRIRARLSLRRSPHMQALMAREVEFEQRLSAITVEPHSANFCARIIASSAAFSLQPEHHPIGFFAALARLLLEIAPPRPAMSLSVIVLAGVILGYVWNEAVGNQSAETLFSALFSLQKSVL